MKATVQRGAHTSIWHVVLVSVNKFKVSQLTALVSVLKICQVPKK